MTPPLLYRPQDSPLASSTDAAAFFGASLSSTTSSRPPPANDEVLDMAALSAEFAEMSSPTTTSMRIRLRKAKSMRATAAAALRGEGQTSGDGDGDSEPPKTEKRLVARVKKNRHAQEARGAFYRHRFIERWASW
jgi:hypothetical protein